MTEKRNRLSPKYCEGHIRVRTSSQGHRRSLVRAFKTPRLMSWIPGYELPSRKTLSSAHIPSLYHRCLATVKEKVAKSALSVCITTDCWTSRANESYIAITAHFIDEDYHFKSVLLKCGAFTGSHTSANLSQELETVLDEWNLSEKLIFAVSDNASNITNAIESLHWKHYGCYAHTLNLIVSKALQEVQALLDKVKKIVSHFRRSPVAQEKLLKYQINNEKTPVPKKLIIDVATRWNSTYYMLKRFLEVEEAIKATMALLTNKLPTLEEAEWKTLKNLVHILSPFEEMTVKMSGQNYLTGSLVIVVTRALEMSCAALFTQPEIAGDEAAKKVLQLLQNGLEDRFKKVEFSSSFALCTVLDPRYKDLFFKDKSASEKIKKHLRMLTIVRIQETQKHNPPPALPAMQTSSAVSAFQILRNLIEEVRPPQMNSTAKAIKTIDAFFADDMLGENEDPLTWWREHKCAYPELAHIFRSRCNIVASSVPCERIFSKSGNIITSKRANLASSKVEMLMFLNGNSEYCPQTMGESSQ
ncbi:hATC [Nesidiocoris tenuis]|nr:hATC [Nesidiocoris tenuis]